MLRALPSSMYVNDVGLAALGVSVSRPRGWDDPPPVTDKYTAIPGRAGAHRVASEAEIGTRSFSVTGVLLAGSIAERIAALDTVKRLLGGPDLRIRFSDYPDRMAEAVRAKPGAFEPVGSGGRFTIDFISDNGYLVGPEPDVYTIPNGTEVELLLGTAASDLEFRLTATGAATPTVYYRDAQGLIRGDLSYALNVGVEAGQWDVGDRIEYDRDQQSYLHHNGDVIGSNLSPVLISGHLPSADPEDGDETTGPTLQAVNCDCVAYVRKAWR